MPIRPENRKRYPKDWKEISFRIRSDRAIWRCECTGECGDEHFLDGGRRVGDASWRCPALHGCPHPVTGSRVVLTVAHLDHVPENCDDGNLMAMCQRCHNRYDAAHRQAGRKARERARAAIGDLFPEG